MNNLVKAYSEAFTSTAKCNTYDKGYNGQALPATTCDTVRDLTQPVLLTYWTRSASNNVCTS